MNANTPSVNIAGIRSKSIPRKLAGAETWAGQQTGRESGELPGLTAWVHSMSMGPGHAGGDVH
jgi:hypothetical protein